MVLLLPFKFPLLLSLSAPNRENLKLGVGGSSRALICSLCPCFNGEDKPTGSK